jgi:hypothetical protein
MQEPDHPPEPPARQQRRRLRFTMSALIVGLMIASCIAVTLIPLLAAPGQESQIDRAFQVVFAALFTLLGLVLVLTERQLRRRGWPHRPPPLARLLFASLSGLTFWTGLALMGIALARLEAPAAAGTLNSVFWAVVGLWLLAQLLFNGRRLMRPRRARAPGRNDV